MGDYNKDSEQDKDKTIDFLLREMCDCSREDLLDEFEAASTTGTATNPPLEKTTSGL